MGRLLAETTPLALGAAARAHGGCAGLGPRARGDRRLDERAPAGPERRAPAWIRHLARP